MQTLIPPSFTTEEREEDDDERAAARALLQQQRLYISVAKRNPGKGIICEPQRVSPTLSPQQDVSGMGWVPPGRQM